ncbi:MAG: MBL fold metallo-hydrolase [Planctomycetota bacterium]|jgi:pyrroloquinoline quinone biosynthesis protein B
MRARVLGIAQDAGVPHPGCSCGNCEHFRSEPLLPACLGLVGEAASSSYLIDATPAIGEQIRHLPAFPGGILLTHAHMGHIGGLLQLGPESMNTRGMPVHATPALCNFLSTNGPWELLERRGNIQLTEHEPGARWELEPGLSVESLLVPHRNEYADTVGYLVSDEERTLLYLPDIDRWEIDPGALVDRCDLALLDGTFASAAELPRQREVPHPPIEETLKLLSPEQARKVRFIHLNHTNPKLLDHHIDMWEWL